MEITPIVLYKKMFDYYGPQNWWPGTGFEIVIGAILTQNSSWKNVDKSLENLKRADLLEPEKILHISIDTLKELIRPSGYFNQKADYLKNISKLWVENNSPTRDELLAVKGIGDETADAILLYLLEKPEFVIDAYTIRISQRLGFGNSSDKRFWKIFYQKSIEKNIQLYNEFHALFVIHAKVFCKKNEPNCSGCFLLDNCFLGKKRNKITQG